MQQTSSWTAPLAPAPESMLPSVRLHLGCGLNVVPGWTNVDGSWNARLARYPRARRVLAHLRLVPRSQVEIPWSTELETFDVTRRFPYPEGSVAAIYASHLLEHLYRADALRFFSECLRVLAPGGVLRLVVPDLRAIVEEYTRAASRPIAGGEEPAAERLNGRLLLRAPEVPRRGIAYTLYSALRDFHSHKWMYDGQSLAWHLARAGFVEVSERAFCDSRIADVAAIERADRVLGGAGVCVEALRPGRA